MTNKALLDSFSSVASGVDLSQIPPIHQKRLLTFINHFIISTVSFLNHFAQTCESKLLSCDQKMQKLEAELCILEAKLNSIPGLEVAAGNVKPSEAQSQMAPSVDSVEKPSEEFSPSTSTSAPSITDDQVGEVSVADNEITNPPVERDPELTRFFKMVQFGVPVPAVKLKMQQEGFNPDLLDS